MDELYKTKEIADLVGIHPNTVRIYEDWGFISPVPRQRNNYRRYSEQHLFQLKLARRLFRCEIVQGNMRHRARQIVYASGARDYERARRLTEQYIAHLQWEYDHAVSAASAVQRWLNKEPAPSSAAHSRKQAAQILGTTPETIRNWERNGLIRIPRSQSGHRVYGSPELERLQVIRALRAAHYSLTSILRLLNRMDQPHPDAIKTLNTPAPQEEILSVADQLVHSLATAKADANEVLSMLTSSFPESENPEFS